MTSPRIARLAALGTLALALATTSLIGVPAADAATSANLIVNGDVNAGHCTGDWTAATTLPGWTIASGSPDVICSSAGSFGYPSGTTPDAAFFAPGNQGDGTIEQSADVSSAATAIDGGTVAYSLSGLLGGWTNYPGYAQVSLEFRGSSGAQIGAIATLPTVSAADRGDATEFLARSTTGTVPAGTRSILVMLSFLDSAGETGYAEHLSLTLNTPVTTAPLSPPPSAVPAYDHVFMIMMENTDYTEVTGSPSDTPYLHTLMSQGTTLANYHAVYHPSDENYLAIAGGDTYATGATYWPNIKDPGRNIGDELTDAGKSWKAYEQGMGTPCNTSNGNDSYYEPDDAPFINYTDVAGDSAYCQAHLFDTSRLTADLASTSSTPAFSWIAADDYYDGEASGNGDATSLQTQDGWLEQTIAPILSSPAWTTQRSLLIVTWDEDENEPGNHVATIVLGSQATVRAGAVSQSRYDHYGTARTIEQALGISPLTANDAYATPLNDAFTDTGTSAAAGSITADSTTVAAGRALAIDYDTTAAYAGSTNWIGLYPLGVSPGSQPSLEWQYAAGTGGTVNFAANSLPSPGTYALWYLYGDGYTALAGPLDVTVG